MSELEYPIPYDKCQVCGHVEKSTTFGERCPICGSEDIDDANFDPYKDDDEEEELW